MAGVIPQLVRILIVVTASACLASAREQRQNQCQRITIPMCVDIGYNMTRMPNFFGHDAQVEAAPRIHEFSPLVTYGCSEHLRFFLCSLYAPMCSPQVDIPIPACRPMCETVRDKCEPVMQSFGISWPDALKCDTLPRGVERDDLCMVAPNMSGGNEGEAGATVDPDGGYHPGGGGGIPKPTPPSNKPNGTDNRRCPNHERFVMLPQTKSCVPRCDRDVYFQQSDKKFAELWMGIWSILCFVGTAVTVLTFLIDRGRFRYPERPIIFLSMCYNMYSVSYIIRLFAGPRAIACGHTAGDEYYLIQEGLESTGCTVVFLIQYYFYMASSIWWVILTLTWFLAAGMKWGYEAIAAYSSYYHLAAWALPALKTIIVLTLRRMDGDELTGMCFVGNQDPVALAGFVLAPLFVYFAVGTLFILAGFFYMFRIRKVMKSGGTNIDKLEKLMVRIGVFSVLYTVPATSVIACYFYQRANLEVWEVIATHANPCLPNGDCNMAFSIPSVPVLLVKTFMLLVVGITSGMWIWSTKTVQSWEAFLGRIFRTNGHRKQAASLPSYAQTAGAAANPAPGQANPAPGLGVKYTRTPNPANKAHSIAYTNFEGGGTAIV
uniref:Frizzled9/10 n=1 Tax=Patiria pectinifera TaxID=7594 RepID=A0A193PMQ6_PATPE|nr:frizzled9/10 [Patiria pectinifera]